MNPILPIEEKVISMAVRLFGRFLLPAKMVNGFGTDFQKRRMWISVHYPLYQIRSHEGHMNESQNVRSNPQPMSEDWFHLSYPAKAKLTKVGPC